MVDWTGFFLLLMFVGLPAPLLVPILLILAVRQKKKGNTKKAWKLYGCGVVLSLIHFPAINTLVIMLTVSNSGSTDTIYISTIILLVLCFLVAFALRPRLPPKNVI